MEEKQIERLLVLKDLTTIFFSRILFKEIYDFNESNILGVKHKHCQVGFIKCMLSENHGELFMFYNSDGHYTDPIHKNYWQVLYDFIKASDLFIEEYKLSDKHYIFKVRFLKQYLKDYDLILEGKYSKLSKSYMSYYPGTDSLLYHLHYKTSDIKEGYSKKFKVPVKAFNDVELGPKIDKDKEIYKVNFGINV